MSISLNILRQRPYGDGGGLGTAPGERRRALTAAAAGNTLEWYDWACYSVFSLLLAPQFFPKSEPMTALLATLAIFAVGFFFRPVGGVLLGAYADRYGRARALVLSVSLMAGGSLLIAAAPTYAAAGVLSPLLLLVARIAQGLSAGGEATAMTTFVVESAPAGRRGLHASVIHISSTIGVLIATVSALVLRATLGQSQLASWGWRIPFAAGAIAGLCVLYMRLRLRETPAFEQTRGRPGRTSRTHALRGSSGRMLQVAGLTAGLSVTFYTFSVHLPTFAQRHHGVSANQAWWASTGALVVFIAVAPLLGLVSDRVGPERLLVLFGIGSAVLAPISLGYLGSSGWTLLAGMVVMLVLYACGAVAMPVVVTAMFPTAIRSTAIGVSYALTVAVAGGSAPYLIHFLANRQMAHWYTGYIVVLCLLTAVTAALLARRRSAASMPQE